ncbi:MAG: HAD-IC family P-type ATPase [Patescibacteria group bacterium]
MISKGATEELLTVCEFIAEIGGTRIPLEAGTRSKIIDLYKSLSSDGFRVLAIATKEISNPKKTYEGGDETNMVFQGFVAFFDPPKKTVTETLRYLKEHGVEIKILTGDNELVTKKVASEINLQVEGVLTGPEIELMNDDELALHVKKTNIFARVLPAQKQRIIMCLKSHGHVVGFLGDGINDAPSLRAADVGISVDNAVDVAKETADLILMKKGLNELVSGIIEGRKTFTNTLKYLMMDMSSNFGNMFSMAGASLFIPFLPMLPAQVLLNNVLYDISQFALPFDNVDPEDIKYPRKWNIGMIRRYMLVFGPVSSVFDFVTFYILLNVLQLNASGFQTGWFLESLATETLVVHIIRTRKIPFLQSFPSAILVFSTLATLGVGFIISTTKIGSLMGFTPLSTQAILGIAVIVAIYLATTNVTKILFFKYFGNYLKDSPRD